MTEQAATPIMQSLTRLPNHIAIIMDGNGRWAERRSLPRFEGHRAGVKRIRPLIKILVRYGIEFLTIYSFSTENWNRPEDEINGLLQLLKEAIKEETPKLHKEGVKIVQIGRLEGIPDGLKTAIRQAEELTENNTRLTLSVAFNYGGRTEILDAIHRLIREDVPPQALDDKLFSNYLYTADLPDVDLVIRTGGELRISNFLIWQAAYSEFYFTKVLWPDFSKKEIERALLSYSQRKRRFGGL